MRSYIIMLVFMSLAACSSKEGAGGGAAQSAADCPAFELKVDGQPVTGLTNQMAFTHKKGKERTHQVQWLNHDKATCADITSLKGRPVADGEITVSAFTGGAGAFGKGIATSAYTEMGVDVTLVGEAPAKPGDKLSLCIPEKTIKPTAGDYEGKTLTIKGLMEGSWCGFMDWDAK